MRTETNFDLVGLPANTDAEKTILGAVLLDNMAFFEAVENGIEADDFSLDSNRRVFLRMADLMEGGRPIDIITLAHELDRNHEVEAIGGVAYIASLTEGLPRRPVISAYLRIVKDKAMVRRSMEIFAQSIALAADGGSTALEVVGSAIEMLEESTANSRGNGKSVADILIQDAPQFEREADSHETGVLGASLFTAEISRITCGLQDNELCLLCARPGQGKTEAAIQTIVENGRRGLRVHMQSMEMKKEQIVRRMVRYMARVPVSHMRDPRCLMPEERARIHDAREELLDLAIVIDDTHELTVSEYRSRSVLAAKRWKADLLVADYAQLLLVPRAKGPVEEAKKQAETLRHIARDYCRTIALAQLRRCPPNDLNRYPDIEDIFGSSAFEQAAQMILLLHRTRENKTYTGEDYCFLAKMRELQIIQPLGIRAEKWGEFIDRYAEQPASQSHWQERS